MESNAVRRLLAQATVVIFAILSACLPAGAQAPPAYRVELGIPYCTVDGRELRLNAFLPENGGRPAPAMVEIHGGWWSGGGPAGKVEQVPGAGAFTSKGIALFSIAYRLGKEGAFPRNIRDCRNAVRFVRKNAARFGVDPERIGCMGGSAGGHLSLMVAMVPEEFDDGGPAEGLEGVSARVCCCFSYAAPTDFVRQWNDAPDDLAVGADGRLSPRPPDGRIPNDARPRLRVMFGGITPDTEEHRALYTRMSPAAHVRKDVPPLLICDGEKDPVVPGLEGKALHEKLQAAGADSIYWVTPAGGHGYPGGRGFREVLDAFLMRTLKLDAGGR